MNSEWIDIKKELPPEKTWVEAIFRCPCTDWTFEDDWFYWSGDRVSVDDWVTHWRFITHPFFSPIVEQPIILELPINAIR